MTAKTASAMQWQIVHRRNVSSEIEFLGRTTEHHTSHSHAAAMTEDELKLSSVGTRPLQRLCLSLEEQIHEHKYSTMSDSDPAPHTTNQRTHAAVRNREYLKDTSQTCTRQSPLTFPHQIVWAPCSNPSISVSPSSSSDISSTRVSPMKDCTRYLSNSESKLSRRFHSPCTHTHSQDCRQDQALRHAGLSDDRKQ